MFSFFPILHITLEVHHELKSISVSVDIHLKLSLLKYLPINLEEVVISA